MSWWSIGQILVWFLSLAAVATGLGLLLSARPRHGESRPDVAEALRILKVRYASGEIDHPEFEARSAVLAGHS